MKWKRSATRERILKEAKTQAQVEGQKLLDEAKSRFRQKKTALSATSAAK